jgi:hypothetical protein
VEEEAEKKLKIAATESISEADMFDPLSYLVGEENIRRYCI